VLDLLAALPREPVDGVRWTTREQWHVTLAFLGRTDPERVLQALADLDHPQVEVTLDGRVGRLGRDALVVPVRGVDQLAADVRRALDLEPARFVGHLTLARLKQRPACGLVDHPVRASWTADSIALVASDTLPTGVVYRTLAAVALGPGDGGRVDVTRRISPQP
jgi:2'-5' RNA ligase